MNRGSCGRSKRLPSHFLPKATIKHPPRCPRRARTRPGPAAPTAPPGRPHLVDVPVGAAAHPLDKLVVLLRIPPQDVRGRPQRGLHLRSGPAPAGSARGAPVPAKEGERRRFPTWSLRPGSACTRERAQAGERRGLGARAARQPPSLNPAGGPAAPSARVRAAALPPAARPPRRRAGPARYLRGRPRSLFVERRGPDLLPRRRPRLPPARAAARPAPRASRPRRPERPLRHGRGAHGRRRLTTLATRGCVTGRHVPGQRGSAPSGPPERAGRGPRVPP